MRFLFLAFLALCLAGTNASVTRYDDFKVYRLYPATEEQNDLLSKLEEGANNLDFWKGVNKANQPVYVMVAPNDQEAFVNAMLKNEIPLEVMTENVQELIDNEEQGILGKDGRMNWTSYFRLADIYTWLDQLAGSYSSVSTIIGGTTFQGRQIRGVRISFRSGRRAVFIEGGIHAREWISPATVTYLINELLTSTDPAFRKIADSFDWYLFPVANPDGYEFSHTNTRLWRKTRTPYGNCFGADPNRNWDAHWMSAGTSTNPCSDTYGGPTVFSETSTSTLSQYISTVASSLDVYISFHSFGQMLLMPYGHTTAHLDNYNDVLQIGRAAIAALAQRYNTRYVVGNVAETIYLASGSSMDWVKGTHRTPIAYTYELRDSGTFGFVLPPSQIIPNCLEVMDSIVGMFNEAERLGYFVLG